jgi:hypothetical protein
MRVLSALKRKEGFPTGLLRQFGQVGRGLIRQAQALPQITFLVAGLDS